jgi:hypothetical protein
MIALMVSWRRNLTFPLTLAGSALVGACSANIDSQDCKAKATVNLADNWTGTTEWVNPRR